MDAGVNSPADEGQEAGPLVGGGEMGVLVRAHDWGATELGPITQWPQSLRTAVDVCLNSRFPMVVFWGPSLITIYNDDYRPSFGAKHPHVLGAPAATLWPEAWHVLGPLMKQVVDSGVPTWSEDQLLPVNRKGFVEETYWTFSYSPVRGESGRVDGVFTAVTETTTRVLGERRLRTLRELASEAARVRSVQEIASVTGDVLSGNPRDLPFALIYLGDSSRLLLKGRSGQALTQCSAPHELLASPAEEPLGRVFLRVLERGEAETLEDPCRKLRVRCQQGEAPPERALVLPIVSPGQQEAAGVLIVGLSPLLQLDESYRGFLTLVSGQLATALSTATAYEEEKKRAEALAELDRAKTAFFSNVSHEFRTPLTLILGPVEEALTMGKGGLEGADLETVRRNSLRLLKLVNTLLDFSRIEAGRVRSLFEPMDLSAFTAELASTFRSLVEKAGLQLVVDCPPLPEPLWVDREMWEKVVLNLLSNAFKFTFKGEIAVTLRPVNGHAELTVRDTGTGIPPAELPHIFERFHRIQGAQSRSYEGTGIGLALVQELVKRHGGSVRVDSAIGRGSSFTVSIPFGNAHLPREGLSEKRALASTSMGPSPFLEEAAGWLGGEESSESPEPLANGSARSRGAPLVPKALRESDILVADDNADMRAYLERLLRAQGWRVRCVANGQEALELARASPPDLVLSDVMMPRLDGIGLLNALRSEERTRTLPIILLSARAGEEATAQGLESGADDYLIKPFSARELVARVGATLAISRLRHQVIEEKQAQAGALQQRVDFEQQLAGIVSHDLRNPLNAILLAAQALLRRDDLNEPQMRSVVRIHSSAQRAIRLIHDLLDFTQARLGRGIPVERRRLELHSFVRQVLEEVQANFPERQIQVQSQGDGRGKWDSDRLAQVLTNLLSNALKYSPAEAVVSLHIRDKGDWVELAVHNQGAPIPPEAMERLFQPLQRGSSQVDSSNRSVGLGLYIVKHIVEAHGGSIEVTSNARAGTTFLVRLPRWET